jgi:ribosome-binding protein aMBF1 (putative translation factor)
MFVKNKSYYFDLDSIRIPHKVGAKCGPWAEYQDHVRGKVNKYYKSQKIGVAEIDGKDKTSYPNEKTENFGSPRTRGWREVETDEEEIKKLEKQTYGSVGKRAKLMLMKGKITATTKKRLEDVAKYLKNKLKESGLSVPQLAQITGLKETTISHYFRTDISGQALPDRSTWEIFKPILGLGEYDDYIDEEIRSALPNPHPLGKNPGDVWEISTQPAPPEARGKHFAIFPEKLVIPMILAGCPVGGLVLDPFMGAGTTAVVAKKLGRNYLGIEINPEFVEIAEKRLKKIPENLFNGNV